MSPRDPRFDNNKETPWLRASTAQMAMLRKRISTRSEVIFPGREEAFFAWTGDGAQYVCKTDRDDRPVRATEWFFTVLSTQLGIPTAACEIIEDDDGVATFFGSQYVESPSSEFEVRNYLSRPSRDEIGKPTAGWLPRYLAQLYALDLMIHNDDRQVCNFMLNGQTLLAIDFASARLDALATLRFPVASSATVGVGKQLRLIHGFDLDAALEMTNRISALPASVVEGILEPIPADWLSDSLRRGVRELWRNGQLDLRLDALRSGLRDGSLL